MARAESALWECPDRVRSALLRWRKIQQGPESGPFFPHGQSFRWRVGFRQPFAVTDAPGFGGSLLGLLLGDRRESGQSVQVGDDAGQHPEHAGTVKRDIFRLGIGLRAQVHHDVLPAIQASQPLATTTKRVHLARNAGLEVGVALGGDRLLIAPLTEPPRDLAGFLRAQELVDPA